VLIKPPNDILPSEITSETLYQNRRHFLQTTVATAVTLATPTLFTPTQAKGLFPTSPDTSTLKALPNLQKSPLSTTEELTPLEKIISYSNFYEFGHSKSDPMRYAHTLKIRPWQVIVSGEVTKPGILDIEDILQHVTLEERIYRHRCVEGWSMVIPWVGFPLSNLFKRFPLTSKAKYVQFFTLHDPQQMPEQQSSSTLNWPYTEGLRIDEAMHPLTILSVGLYGKTLPNENGAPLRLVVPWKYGFKSIKSIVKIRLVEEQPLSSWQEVGPSAYGFYSNVNPEVPHPRWSQAKERRIGELTKRPTLMFNGYADQVAQLYQGMDLQKDY
jgi:sulfoxide reductase catalytic subunit YedY